MVLVGAVTGALTGAQAQLGTPYRWGGEGPGGFDCSGLVQAAYAAAGIRLPRVAQQQYNTGPHLRPDAPLLPGDLVFFGTSSTHVTHVGMVVSPGLMIDAPFTGAIVRIEPSRGRPTSAQPGRSDETYRGGCNRAAGRLGSRWAIRNSTATTVRVTSLRRLTWALG